MGVSRKQKEREETCPNIKSQHYVSQQVGFAKPSRINGGN